MNIYQSPLNLYVIWHPAYKAIKSTKDETPNEENCYGGKEYAEFIYSTFSRELENPLTRGVGIPTYYRSQKREDGTLKPIGFHEAKRNAIVVLAEAHMLEDDVYKSYIRKLHDQRNGNALIFFFVMDKYGKRIDPSQNKRLYESIYEIKATDEHSAFQRRCQKIREVLAHDLCRMLMDESPSFEDQKGTTSKAPIKLFLSHAQADGAVQAKAIHQHVYNQTKLDTFLDIQDINTGDDIREKLVEQMGIDTALVVIQTDDYSNRLWCQDELHHAKARSIPMVVVNDLKQGEKRAFPYLGNVPSIKWQNNSQAIIDLALMQVLTVWFSKKSLEELANVCGVRNHYKCFTVGQPPELLDLVELGKNTMKRENHLVLYPDPPLSRVETRILKTAQPLWVFATPASLSQYL